MIAVIVIGILAGAVIGLYLHTRTLGQLLKSETALRLEMSTIYTRESDDKTRLMLGCLDRRLLMMGSVPLDESLAPEDMTPEQPESVDDIKRLLQEEEAGAVTGRGGKISDRRELIRQMRDAEEADAHPRPRTVAQEPPYDATLNVQSNN